MLLSRNTIVIASLLFLLLDQNLMQHLLLFSFISCLVLSQLLLCASTLVARWTAVVLCWLCVL